MKKTLYTTALLLIILFGVYSVSKGQEITVLPNIFVFDDTFIGETTSADFNFANTGTEVLNITDITFTNSAFSIDYTAFPLDPGQSGDIPVHFNPPTEGLFEGTMQIWSDDPINNPYDVELSGNGVVELIDGWEWIETGFNFILMDIEFPEGQNQIGYSIGQSLTYNGDGIVIKTTDGGTTWEQLTPDGIPGLQGCSFLDVNTGFAAGWDGYLIKTTDGGVTWDTIVVQNNIWQIIDVEFRDIDNGVVAAHTDGTFVTQDGGQTWTEGTGLTTSPQMIEYADDTTLFIVGGEDRINRSTDGGLTWTEVYGDGNTNFILLGVDFLDSHFGMAAGDYGHIYTTTDGGDTWTLTEPFGDELLHTPFIWDEDTIWVCGTPERVYKTTDGGLNWNNAYNGNYQKAFYRITFTDNYTGFICGGSGGIVLRKEGLPPAPELMVTPNTYVYDDTYVGETTSADFNFANTGTEVLNITDITFTNPAFSIEYTAFPLQPGQSGDIPVYFDPPASGLYEGTMQIWSDDPINNPYEVELSGNGIVELIDGWEWIETGYNFILMDIEFPEGQNQVGYCIGESLTYNGDGVVIKTTDGGSTWTQLTPEGIPGLTGMSFIDMNTGYAVGWDDYLIKTTDGGTTWDTINYATGTFSFYYDVEFYDANNGVVLASNEVFVTDDGGATWTPGNGLTNSCNMIEYVDETTLVTVGNENFIFRSIDGGLNWTVVNPSTGIGPVLLGVHFMDNHYGMAAGDYGWIYTTEDGGETWTGITPVGDQLLHTPFIWDEDTAWVCGTPEMVYKTTDGGTNWNSAYNGNYQKAFYRITFTDNYTGFICGGSGGIVLRKEGLPEIPAINVTPEDIEFDDTYVGENTSEILFISNPGFADLEVTDITSTNDVFSVDMTTFTIEPGDVQEITVTFTPDDESLFDGLLQIENNDPENSIVEVAVSGNGMIAIPAIEINPTEIIFDTTLVDETTMEIITISNTGIATLNVSDIVSTNAVFSVNMTSFDLEPDESQEIEVSFAPDDEGLFEGLLQIENNDPENSLVEVAVFGNGMIAYPAIEINPTEIIFDTTLVDETTMETIIISNTGIATLNVTDIVSTNVVFSVNMTSFDLEPDESQEIEITFAPDEQMLFEGVLQVESNDPNGTIEIDLSGYGDIDTYIGDYNSNSSVRIYPNPAKDKIYLENIKGKEIIIYDLLGNLKLSYSAESNTEVINVSDYVRGLYLVKIVGKEGIITKKLEVVR